MLHENFKDNKDRFTYRKIHKSIKKSAYLFLQLLHDSFAETDTFSVCLLLQVNKQACT